MKTTRPVGLDIDRASTVLDLDTLETEGLLLEHPLPARDQALG